MENKFDGTTCESYTECLCHKCSHFKRCEFKQVCKKDCDGSVVKCYNSKWSSANKENLSNVVERKIEPVLKRQVK